MTNDKQSSFKDLVAITEKNLRPIIKELRKTILAIDPNACEVVRLGDRAATYGLGPKKLSEGYCYVLPYKSWVNLGFNHGAHLLDPSAVLEGSGKNMRHVKIYAIEDIHRPAISSLIKAAIKERTNALSAD